MSAHFSITTNVSGPSAVNSRTTLRCAMSVACVIAHGRIRHTSVIVVASTSVSTKNGWPYWISLGAAVIAGRSVRSAPEPVNR